MSITEFKLHHIGYATNNIEKSLSYFLPFLESKECKIRFKDTFQKVDVEFYSLKGDLLIEFIKPNSNDSPVLNFLKKFPEGYPHHFAYESGDFYKSLESLKKSNYRMVTKETIGFEKRKIVFFTSREDPHQPLIEIVSKENFEAEVGIEPA
tara:strand:+ start:968 stop:1420 length:453 start_codon:yes stop_codon:yes gene_type:complete